MRIAEFDIGISRGEGEVVRVNDKTVVVKLRRGGKTKQIKRHIDKHRVTWWDDDGD